MGIYFSYILGSLQALKDNQYIKTQRNGHAMGKTVTIVIYNRPLHVVPQNLERNLFF